MELITNRTAQDVERWKTLRGKGWAGMTELEKQEWLGELSVVPNASKGMYTHNDMNRVERAVKDIATKLITVGFLNRNIETKTDWSYTDVLTKAEMSRYLGNLKLLADSVSVQTKVPTIDEKLDYNIANNIEKILMEVSSVVEGIIRNRWYANEIFSGEV